MERNIELLGVTQNLAHIGGWEWNTIEKTLLWTAETYHIHDLDPDDHSTASEKIAISLNCYSPEYRSLIHDAFERCCNEGVPYDLELQFVTVKGRHLWVKTIGNPTYENGTIVKVSGYIIDITRQKMQEEALKYSEMKFRAIIEQAAEMLFLHDMQGNIVEVNKAAVEQTGYSAEELLKMSVFDLDPDAADRLDRENIWNTLGQLKNRRFEVRHRRKDGSEYPAEVSVGKIFFGDTEYILGMVKDVTSSKEAERSLIESERHAKALIEAIPDMIFRMNSAGVFLSYKAAREDLYLDPELFIGKKIHEVMPEWVAVLAVEKIHEALSSNNIQVFDYELSSHGEEPKQFECRMVPYGSDEVVAIVRNISEKKNFEKKLSASEAKYRTLFENLPLGIFYQNADGKVTDANDAACAILGLSRGQLMGIDSYDKHWKVVDERYEIFPPEKHPSMLALHSGLPVTLQTIGVYNPEINNYRWLIVNAIPEFRNGETTPYQVFASMQDITPRKHALEQLVLSEQNLQEMNKTKDKFFSIIAHDLKTPFSSILGFSELLVEQIHAKNYDDIGKYATIILASSKRMLDLLTNLLDWSRSQTGKMEFNPEYLEINGLIHDVIQITTDLAYGMSIAIEAELKRKTLVLADKNMISAVLRNLITNAVKYTNSGGKVAISAETHPHELVISVADNGVGIDEESIQKLFRIDESYSTNGTQNERGTGLGLILCKEFVEKHGGRIWAESEAGKGSVFRFSLPLEH